MDIRSILKDHGIEDVGKGTIEGSFNDLEATLADLNQFVQGSFRDGIITQVEARKIQVHLNQLEESDKKVQERYKVISENVNLEEGAVKSELFAANGNYELRYSALISEINYVIADNKATSEESTDVDEAYLSFIDAVGRLEKAMEVASDAILNKRSDIAEQNAIQRAEEIKDEVTIITDDIDNRLKHTEGYIDGAFRDGVINEFEAKNIRSYLESLRMQKTELDNRYVSVYNNYFLEGVPKQNLKSAKLSYNQKFQMVLDEIENAILDFSATPAEAEAVRQAFVDLDSSLDLLVKCFEEAIETFSQKRADEAENLAVESSKEYTDREVGTIDNILKTITSDSVITLDERSSIKDEIMKITGNILADTELMPDIATLAASQSGEFYSVRSEATNVGVLSTHPDYIALDAAYDALKIYLNAFTPKPWDVSDKTNIEVDKVIWRNKWLDYYLAVAVLRERIAATMKDTTDEIDEHVRVNTSSIEVHDDEIALRVKEKVYRAEKTILDQELADANQAADSAAAQASSAQTFAENAQIAADAADQRAANAATEAQAATQELLDLADDKKLTPGEKQDIKREWETIKAEKPTILAQADMYSIVTERSNYIAYYDELSTYITPLLTDTTTTSTIVAATFIDKFKNYYDRKTVLLKVISNAAKTRADNAQDAADTARIKADNAQNAADKAQGDVDALDARVSSAETSITQTSHEISLMAQEYDAIEGRVSEAEQKITPSAITTTVRSSTEYNQDFSGADTTAKGYADQAESNAKGFTNSKLTNFVDSTLYSEEIGEIRAQIDNQIESHFYDHKPTLSNMPASEWTTDTIKKRHIGDIFYDKITGYSYRFMEDQAVYKWKLIRDEGISKALQDAANAQDTADNKRRTFVARPTTPYDKGDLWVDETNSKPKVYSSLVDKTKSATFSQVDWELIGDVTGENTALDTQYVNGELASQVTSRLTSAEQRITDEAITSTVTESVTYKADQTSLDSAAQGYADTAQGNAESYANTIKQTINGNIDDVETSLSNLDQEIHSTFKDGVIEESEAKAIEKYINTLSVEKESIEKRYLDVSNNEDLTGQSKADLLNAKASYTTSHQLLISKINDAIFDDKTTTTEKVAVDTQFADYQSKLSVLSQAFEEAVNTIAQAKANRAESGAKQHADDRIDPLATRVSSAEQKITPNAITSTVTSSTTYQQDLGSKATPGDIDNAVKGLRIGGTNLFPCSDFEMFDVGASVVGGSGVTTNEISDIVAHTGTKSWKLNTGTGGYVRIRPYDEPEEKWLHLEKDELVIITMFVYPTAAVSSFRIGLNGGTGTVRNARSFALENVNSWQRLGFPLTVQGTGDYWIYVQNADSDIYIDNIQVENGNVATNWSPAPQDTTNAIHLISDELEGFKTTVNTSFADGLIEKSEAKAIEKYINVLDTEKVSLDERYTQLHGNADLAGNAKSNLAGAKSAYDSSHSGLMSAINNAIQDDKATPTEANNVNNKFADYKLKVKTLMDRMETAINVIAQNKATDAQNAAESNAKSYADGLKQTIDGDINTVTSNLSDLDTEIKGTFKDGIIEQAEAKSIATYINTLNTEKGSVDERYTDVYNNASLTGTPKTNLEDAKTAYNNAHSSLTSIINTAIGDGRTTTFEKADVDTKFTDYKNRLATLSLRFNEAVDAIAQKKVDDIDIGGRNIILNSDFATGDLSKWRNNGSVIFGIVDGRNVAIIGTAQGIYQTAVKSTSIYTFSFVAKALDSTTSARVGFLNQGTGARKIFSLTAEWKKYSYTTTKEILDGQLFHIYSIGKSYYITDIKVEKGNKATDWTTAPEDVTAAIDDVLTELSNFEDTVNTTFKDGIIEQAEAKAIEKYKNTLNAEKSNVDNRYTDVYGNGNLSGSSKSNLSSAKASYNMSHSDLIGAINNAISDNKATASEKTNVDNKFADYKAKVSLLSKRFEEAINYIAQAKANNAEQNAKSHADGLYEPLESRVSTAEQKITSNAITNTVTSSTTYQQDFSNLDNSLKSYVNDKTYKYSANAYQATDDASAYSPKSGVAVMEVSSDLSWPDSYGTVTTYWAAYDRANQYFVGTDTKMLSREVHTASYPNWSSWKEMEDTVGAQSKANTAESNSKGYTKGWSEQGADVTANNSSKSISLKDTRDTDETPDWYYANYPKQVVSEFKYGSTFGGIGSETYGTLITRVQWTGSSGGKVKQEFTIGDDIFYRQGTGTTWETWRTAEDKAGAQNKADTAEGNAKAYAVAEANDAESNAKQHADNTAADLMDDDDFAETAVNYDTDNVVNAKVNTIALPYVEGRHSVITSTNAPESLGEIQAIENPVVSGQVGGRNIILSSNKKVDNSSYPNTTYTLSETTTIGTTYTYQIKGTLSEDQTVWLFYGMDGNSFGAIYFEEKHDIESGIYYGTFQATRAVNAIKIYGYPNSNFNSIIDWIQLEQGNKATDWTPAPEDTGWQYSQTINSSFYGDGATNDRLTWDDDGNAVKAKNWEDVTLTGDMGWVYSGTITSGKRVVLSDNAPGDRSYSNPPVVIKYDGTLLDFGNAGQNPDTVGQNYWDGIGLMLSVLETDSGWGASHTPTPAEIKAYFNGWRMCNGTFGTPYNGSGTKTWHPIGDTDLSRQGDEVDNDDNPTAPTSVANTIPEETISHYQLVYQLAEPVYEEVEFDGIFELGQGINTVVIEDDNNIQPVSSTLRYANSLGTAGKQTTSQMRPIMKRLASAEEIITDDSIINTVTDSVEYKSFFDQKANTSELGNLATKGEVDSLGDDMANNIQNAIDDINFEPYATKSELEQTSEQIEAKFSATGGMNLVQNSVGFGGFRFWNAINDQNIRTISNKELDTLGFGSGFRFLKNTQYSRVEQEISVVPGIPYTLAWRINKTSTKKSWIGISEDDGSTWNYFRYYASSATTNGYEADNETFTPTAGDIRLRVMSHADATFTGIMLNIGDIPLQWSLSTGEFYNTNISMDITGLRVSQLNKDRNEIGFTQITPDEFAGYYDSNRDGNFEKIFYLNEDETVTKKIRAKEEITMGRIKIVKLNNGWAFVPIAEDL